MKKRLRIITYSSLAFLLLALAAGFALLHSPAVSRLALQLLTEEISRNLDGTLRFSSVEGSLATGMTVTGLSIATPEREWLAVDTLSLRYDPFTVAFGLVHLKDVHADGVRLTVRRDASGGIAWPFLRAGGAALSAKGWKILGRLDAVGLSRGAVSVLDPDSGEEPRSLLDDVHFRGRFGFSSFFARGGWSAWCEVQESGFRLADSGLLVSASARKLLVYPDSLEIVEARVATPSSSVTFHLRKPQGQGASPTLSWHAPVLDLRDWGFPAAPAFATSGTLKGIARSASLRTAGASGWDLPAAYRLVQDVEVAGSRFSCNGELSFAEGLSRPSFQGAVGFDALDPAALAGVLREAAGSGPAGFREAVDSLAGILTQAKVQVPLTGGLEDIRAGLGPDGTGGVSGVLSLRSGSIAGTALKNLRAPFRLENDGLAVTGAELLTDAGEIRLETFQAGLPGGEGGTSGQWRLAASFAGLEAGRLLDIAELPGGLSGSVRMESLPDGIRGEVALDAFQVKELHVDGASALLRKGPDSLLLDRLEFTVSGQRVTGRGGLAAAGLNLEMEAKDLPLSLLAPEGRGALDASAKLTGTFERPRLEAMLYAKGVELPGVSAEKLSGRLVMPDPLHDRKAGLSVEGSAVSAWNVRAESVAATLEATGLDRFLVQNAEAALGGERWRLSAPVAVKVAPDAVSCGKAEFSAGSGKNVQLNGSWMQGGKADAWIALQNFPVTLPIPVTGGGIGGRLDAEASLQGTAFAPAGTVTATFTADRNGLLDGARFKGLLAEGRLTADGEIGTPGGTVRLQGLELPLLSSGTSPPVPDLASARGDIVLQEFELGKLRIPGQESLSGRLAARMHVASFAEGWPEAEGEFQLAGAGIALPAADVRVQGAHGGLRLTPGRLALSGVEVESSGGTLAVDGSMRLGAGGVEALQLAVGTRRLAVSLQQGVHKGVLSGDVQLTGTPHSPVLAGNVTLEEVATRFPQHWEIADISADVVIYDSRKAAVGSRRRNFFEGLEESLSGVGLNLKIDVPGKMDLSLGALHLVLKGGLTARTEDGRLILNGAFSPEQGEYLVRGRTFKVTEGTVTFTEETGMNGGLHAKAVCQLPGAHITALVRGSINVPEIYLESDPWMPEGDIMASVVLGRPMTPAEQRDAAEKGAMASALLGESVLDRFREMTGRQPLLESVNVYGGTTKEGEHSVSVGKYLSEDLLVSYEHMLGTGEPGQISLEYKLGRGFSVESQMQGAERKGVDLLWKKDF